MEKELSKYEMSIDYNVLNHLGINLYSSIAAVLSEAVANAYDADASEVSIDIDLNNNKVIIIDNGDGMDIEDVNKKYLLIGYQKRRGKTEKQLLTSKFNRSPMGRKGIGKLSLMSIAKKIEIHTMKESKPSEAFLLDVNKIEELINSADKREVYHPEELIPNINTCGTKIVLSEIRKNKTLNDPKKIKKDISRRFALLPNFTIKVNGEGILLADREYFKNVKRILKYGELGIDFTKECKTDVVIETRINKILLSGKEVEINGWIGYTDRTDELKVDDVNLNKISVLSRGKLGQEDILGDLHNSSMFTNYLIGELNADFLDADIDFATSSREGYQKETPAYIALFDFLKEEVKYIGTVWNKEKSEEGVKKAISIEPAIKDWFDALKGDEQKMAKTVLGNINKTIGDETKRREVTKYGILAFEKMRYTKNLSAIDSISFDAFEQLGIVLRGIDEVEASMYYQIVKTRIDVISKLQEITDKGADVKEKVIQDHLFKHLWLLDPSWERPTSNEAKEKTFKKLFDENAVLTEDEKNGRVDICFKDFAGKFIVVELKKYDRVLGIGEIISQVTKYSQASKKCLAKQNPNQNQPYEIIFVLGKEIKDLDYEKASETLAPQNARIVYYDTLINNALNAYKSYFDMKKELNPIIELFEKMDG